MKKNIYFLVAILILIAIAFIAYYKFTDDETKTYAGIEVGTTGVRWAVVQIKKKKEGFTYISDPEKDQGEEKPADSASLLKTDQVQVEPIKLLIQQVLENHITPRKIPKENVFIVVGNSHKNEKSANLDYFSNELKKIYGNEQVEILDEAKESVAEFKTLDSPPTEIENILLIGFGSRSFEFATFTKNGKPFALVTEGTEQLAEAGKDLEKKDDISRTNSNSSTKKETKLDESKFDDISSKIRQTVKEKINSFDPIKNHFRSKKYILIQGGSPFNILCKTGEMNENKYLPMTRETLKKFRRHLKDEFQNGRNFQVKSDKCAQYTGWQELTGLESIELMFDILEVENKTLFFYDRKTWLPGYFINKVENEDQSFWKFLK